MTRPTLIIDQNGYPVQALAPSTTAILTAGATSTRVALPTGAQLVRLAAINDCYVAFGDSNVVASGSNMLFTKGSEIFEVPAGATHVAVIQHTTGGAVTVTMMV